MENIVCVCVCVCMYAAYRNLGAPQGLALCVCVHMCAWGLQKPWCSTRLSLVGVCVCVCVCMRFAETWVLHQA